MATKNKKTKLKRSAAQQLAMSSGVPQRKVVRIGRNADCPCGSGLKYKNCHESEGEAFLQKLTAEQERERLLKDQKEAGAPWYKRFFTRVSS